MGDCGRFRNREHFSQAGILALGCVTSVAKAMAQPLENCKAGLGQCRYAIEHIPRERNCWGDLLSRWVKVPSVPVRSVAVHSPCDAEDSLPSVDDSGSAEEGHS